MKTIYNGFFTVVFALMATTAFAQGIITGTVIDAELNEPLPGANVVVKGTTTGVSTDFDGKFRIEVPQNSGTLVVSYIGFVKKEVRFTSTGDIGNIALQGDAEQLEGVVVVGTGVIDLVKDRQTPIAVSTIKASDIQKASGNAEFPTLLRSMPSVYANTSGGGYGDAQIRVRGFDQSNTAYLLNGQPINGMEDGNMYWSNWQGVRDVATAIQLQRGLGSSKLAISSVGGTMNIVTQSYNEKEKGFVEGAIANNNYIKSTAYYSTGKNENGWSSTYMLSYWEGDGNYFEGTEGKGLTYFLSFGYKPSDKHAFNLLITGAPQTHGQAYQNNIQAALTYGKDYNENWGYKNGKFYNERTNYYHKPVMNFNWDWNISDKSNLSTVAYASIGRGGGTGPLGYHSNKFDDNGQIDFDRIIATNRGLEPTEINGSNYLIGREIRNVEAGYITRASVNNHLWLGTVSNFNHKINDNLEFNVGFDYRFYKGKHYRMVTDFLGLDGWGVTNNGSVPGGYTVFKSYDINLFDPTFKNAKDTEKIGYDYSEQISYIGGFGQIEYKEDAFSAYIQGAISSQWHQRWDYFNYMLPNEQKSQKVNNGGFNLKGGLSYNIDEHHNVFANAGYYSRQPFHDNIYLNFTNDLNPLAENEKITGYELGYKFNSSVFSANLNGYYTVWDDRVEVRSTRLDLDNDGIDEDYFSRFAGLKQVHYGVEFDFMLRPLMTDQLGIYGFASLGNWKYGDNSIQTLVRQDNLEVVPGYDGETAYIDGVKVGEAAQTSFNLGANYKIIDEFSIDVDWYHYANVYAYIDPIRFTTPDQDVIKLPSYNLFRAGLSYTLPLKNTERQSFFFRFNVDNLFNTMYLQSLSTNIAPEDGVDNYKGINVNNRGTFGFGRQWSFSVRYNF
ncbi:TonB-dependent receptor [Sinomicrobium pectinilyticum]|uniref:TonB-dependent receptor n=1 Tax=Sinomicrobium pectinilyticum TaxID=1084421 RepID=A0A3N0EL27_SINP1|nr:TonB-dependent receptor [Sinomicrobium pectinilyticum]RNL88447.1 TonB-dependent receptor [Sinomicrobium pectinilyticum]